MTAEIIQWRGDTKLDVPVENVLQGAQEANLDDVVVLGLDARGGVYFASTYGAAPDTLWLLERCRKRLIEMSDE